MSQFGMTPISILDKGPMGGFRGGLADQRGIMHSDSNLMTETLAQEAQRMQNEKALLDKPMDAIKRAAEMAKLEEEMVLRQQGHFRDKEETELRGKKVDIENKISEEQRKKYIASAEGAMHASSVFSPDDDDATRAAKWGTAVQIAEAAGLKNIPKEYSAYNYQRLMERAKAAPTAIKHLQDMEGKEYDALARRSDLAIREAGDTARNAATNATSEANSKRSAWATVQAAKERSQAGDAYLRTAEQRALQAIQIAHEQKKPLPEWAVAQLQQSALLAAEAAVVKSKNEIDMAKSNAARQHKDVAAAGEAAAQAIRDRVYKSYMSAANGLPVGEPGRITGTMKDGEIVKAGQPTPKRKEATNDVPTPTSGPVTRAPITNNPVTAADMINATAGESAPTQPRRPANAVGQKRDASGRVTHWQLSDGTIVPAQ